MARKIFKPTKMQGGNIFRANKGKENIFALLAQKGIKTPKPVMSRRTYREYSVFRGW